MTARLAFALLFALPVACGRPTPAQAPQECRTAAAPTPASPNPHSHPHDVHSHAHPHPHPHPHPEHVSVAPAHPTLTEHAVLQSYENHGNTLRGIATPGLGATSYEVWRTSVAVGSATPLHRHESEEVFIFLQGKGKARIGDQEFTFEAPATLVAPANVPHQFFNIGDVPTDAIVVVGIGSKIWDATGKEMQLPWRR